MKRYIIGVETRVHGARLTAVTVIWRESYVIHQRQRQPGSAYVGAVVAAEDWRTIEERSAFISFDQARAYAAAMVKQMGEHLANNWPEPSPF